MLGSGSFPPAARTNPIPDRQPPLHERLQYKPDRSSQTNTANMPREISDIKSFIEICRRKDASCTFAQESEYLQTQARALKLAGKPHVKGNAR